MINKRTINELPISERPYEKCRTHGATSLSDAELLAVILRSGTRERNCVELAYEVLSLSSQKPGLLGLYDLSESELQQIPGIGLVKAVQLCCIAELSRRMANAKRPEVLKFTHPADIASYYRENLRHLDKEHVLLLLFDSKCSLIKEIVLSIGSVNSSILSPREVMISALQHKAVSS